MITSSGKDANGFVSGGLSATGGLPWTEIPSDMSTVTNGREENRLIYLMI
jgi:hypothetical protein